VAVVLSLAFRPAPAIATTIRLPDDWRGCELQANYVTPEM